MIFWLMEQIDTTLTRFTYIFFQWPLEQESKGAKGVKTRRNKKEKQSLKGSGSDLITSAVALNVCKNYPGQYTHNLPTQPQTHTQNTLRQQ